MKIKNLQQWNMWGDTTIQKNRKKMDVELNSFENNNNNNNRSKRFIDISADTNHTSNNDFDGGNNDDYPDVDFEYNDADTHFNEIAELYSYTEQNEFQLNVKAFEDIMEQYNMIPCWQKLTLAQRKVIVLKLLEQLDVSNKVIRMRAARCILYLAQGCFIEVQSDIEQQDWTRINVMLLYELGTWNAFIDLLNIEIENPNATNIVMRKAVVSLADSVDLRIILSVLYIITEVMRVETDEYSEYKCHVDSFKQEINQPYGDELLAVKLLGMVTKFCSAAAPHFPMKKVLLLLWKISLVGLGGMETLKKLKTEYRQQFNLPASTEDVFEITKTMRVTSPTPDFTDNLKRDRPLRRVRTNDIAQEGLIKQSSLDEQEQIDMDLPSLVNEEDISDYYRPCDDSNNEGNNNNNSTNGSSETGSESSGCFSNSPNNPSYSPLEGDRFQSRLPWTPKVRQKDIDQFLQISRKKFLGFILYNDNTSLAGLPPPIQEGYKTLKKNVYVSLADIQIKKEETITRNPITNNDDNDLKMTPTEILYQSILPNLPQYMISLLKILLAGLPTSKMKTESINIMADVLPEEMPMTVTQTTKLGIDVNRHKEIIIKAVSAILLLYLKHFKINHIYQFEFMSQHLVFANCIPLVLKFLNQNILEYVASKNVIPIIDFPSCIIGEQPELTSDSLVIGDSAPYSWRNIFSTINLLRILNKLTKWKHSRIMMLVVFKSAPILKRTIHVRHAMMQLFVLKLLKMQTKYLGRQWRKTNMKIISAIYWKVRHRLNDDWAFAHDVDARPWDFQTEECLLRTCVDRFNNRRYLSGNLMPPNRMATTSGTSYFNNNNNNNNNMGLNNNNNNNTNLCSQNLNDLNEYDQNGMIDMNMNNILNGERYNYIQGYGGWDEHVELSDEFKLNYENWLEQEVFNNCIDWDQLFQQTQNVPT